MTEHPGPLHRHQRTGEQLTDQEAADCAAGVLLRLAATRTEDDHQVGVSLQSWTHIHSAVDCELVIEALIGLAARLKGQLIAHEERN